MDSKADTEEGAIQGSIQVLKYDKGDLERYRVRKRRRERERERERDIIYQTFVALVLQFIFEILSL